jgi:hypothetical protein
MPKPVAQLKQALSAFLAPYFAFVIEVGHICKLWAQAQRLIFSIKGNGGLKRSEVPGEVEMLVLRKMLVGKDQDRVVGERFIDCGQVGGPDGTRQVDIADLGSKARRDRIDDYGHSDRLPPRDPRAFADWIITGESVQSDELNKPVAPAVA